MNDYSQYGEGKVIADYFGEFKGTLISLGENDGKTLSNVLGLIEQGWEGILVEPSKEAFYKLTALHQYRSSQVFCVNAAIADHNGEIELYESDEHLGTGDTALLSTCIQSETKRWDKNKFIKTIVPCITFKNLMDSIGLSKVSLISIDCEGMDYDILTQIDFEALGTRCVCVEYNGKDKEKYLNHMKGFNLIHDNGCNLIFGK